MGAGRMRGLAAWAVLSVLAVACTPAQPAAHQVPASVSAHPASAASGSTATPAAEPEVPGRWEALPPAPFAPRRLPLVVTSDEEVLVWGGTVPSSRVTSDHWDEGGLAYNARGREWRPLAKPPIDANLVTSHAWSDGAVYVANSEPWEVARYDLGADARERLPPPLPSTWGGGLRWTGDRLVAFGSGDTLLVAAYDPVDDAWHVSEPAPLEAPRLGGMLVWTGKELVVWGGGSDPCRAACMGIDCEQQIDASRYLDAAAYDPLADAWRTLPDPPIDVAAPSAAHALDDGSILVVARDFPVGLWRWDPDTGEVEPRAALPTWPSASIYAGGDRLWAYTGDHSAFYDVATDTWTPLPPRDLRIPSVIAVLDDRLLLWGDVVLDHEFETVTVLDRGGELLPEETSPAAPAVATAEVSTTLSGSPPFTVEAETTQLELPAGRTASLILRFAHREAGARTRVEVEEGTLATLDAGRARLAVAAAPRIAAAAARYRDTEPPGEQPAVTIRDGAAAPLAVGLRLSGDPDATVVTHQLELAWWSLPADLSYPSRPEGRTTLRLRLEIEPDP